MCELSGAQSVLKFQILPFPTPKLTPEGEEEEDNDIYIEHLLGTASSDFAPTHYFRKLSLSSQTRSNSSLETLRDPCTSTHYSHHNCNFTFLCVTSNLTITTTILLPTEVHTIPVFVSIISLKSWHLASLQ